MKRNVYVLVRNLKKAGGLSKWVVDYYSALTKYPELNVVLIVEKNVEGYNLNSFPFECIVLNMKKKHLIDQFYKWHKIVKMVGKNSWVHLHTDNLVNVIPLLLFKNLNKHFIVQSHSSVNYLVKKNILKKVLNFIGKKIIIAFNYTRFAISNDAAAWLFGKNSYKLIKNGVDLERFKFSEELRNLKRTELTIPRESIVYGQVGRFDDNKNQKKSVRLFYELHKINPNSFLILVGDGKKRKSIQCLVKKLKINEYVKFLGIRSDIPEILFAMDVFIFPSHFEGFGFALIEAQATGLVTYYSDSITPDVDLIDTTRKFSIEEDEFNLAFKMNKVKINNTLVRQKANDIIRQKGYSFSETLKGLYSFYTTCF